MASNVKVFDGKVAENGLIRAQIIADSVWKNKPRITTFLLHYPRIILAEVNTHRMFGRSTESSRAIPVKKRVEKCRNGLGYVPNVFGKNKSGMQSSDPLEEQEALLAEEIWHSAMEQACSHADRLADLKVHKQLANRVLESYVYVNTVVTSTEWENFFGLRAHKDAQDDFQYLADLMLGLYVSNTPTETQRHRPFCDQNVEEIKTDEDALIVGTARSARTSYANFFGDFSLEKDRDLCFSEDPEKKGLAPAGHWSPFEHCADAMEWEYDCGPTHEQDRDSIIVTCPAFEGTAWHEGNYVEYPNAVTYTAGCVCDKPIYWYDGAMWGGNLRGWFPYRKRFAGENRKCDLKKLNLERNGF